MNCPKVLNRYGKPGQYDTVPYGTICRVQSETLGQHDIYRQISNDENNPLWELIEPQDIKKQLMGTAYEDLNDPH